MSEVNWGPIAVVGGLTAVVISNAIMITIALSNPAVPATTDHWAESLDWERELDRRAHSRALGWSIAGLARADQALELRIVDAELRPIAGLQGSLTLRRADSNANDRTLALVELDGGRYRSDQPIPDSGLYELKVALHDDAGDEFTTQRWLEFGEVE